MRFAAHPRPSSLRSDGATRLPRLRRSPQQVECRKVRCPFFGCSVFLVVRIEATIVTSATLVVTSAKLLELNVILNEFDSSHPAVESVSWFVVEEIGSPIWRVLVHRSPFSWLES